MEEAHGQLDCLRVNAVAVHAGSVGAQHGHVFAADVRTGIEEDVMSHSAWENVQLRCRNVCGEVSGARSDGNVLIGLAYHNLDGYRYPLEPIGWKGRTKRRSDSKNGSDPRITIGVTRVCKHFRMLLNQFPEVRHERGKFRRAYADAIVFAGIAVGDEALGVRDAARNLDHSVAAERKARGANPLRVNVTLKLGVSKHTADDFAEIASALPPDRKPFHGVRLNAGKQQDRSGSEGRVVDLWRISVRGLSIDRRYLLSQTNLKVRSR